MCEICGSTGNVIRSIGRVTRPNTSKTGCGDGHNAREGPSQQS